MKIRIISDLHLDVNEDHPLELADKEIFTLICGDTSAYFDKATAWMHQNVKNGLFVTGNHIFYNEENKSLAHFVKQYEEAFPLESNMALLNNAYKIINDIVFVGGTLWTDYKLFGNPDLHKWYATRSVNDYRFGKVEEDGTLRPIRPDDCETMFNETLNFIKTTAKQFPDKKIVVLTHHAPCGKSVPEKFRQDESSPCFASNLEEFILDHPNIKLWCHGHIHTASDYTIGDCRVICNPRGYAQYQEQTGFDENLIVEI